MDINQAIQVMSEVCNAHVPPAGTTVAVAAQQHQLIQGALGELVGRAMSAERLEGRIGDLEAQLAAHTSAPAENGDVAVPPSPEVAAKAAQTSTPRRKPKT